MIKTGKSQSEARSKHGPGKMEFMSEYPRIWPAGRNTTVSEKDQEALLGG